ncbi:MAG: HAD-IIB family hydrolase [Candidatus Atribacteria bacterium]
MEYVLVSDLDETLTGDEEGIRQFNKIMLSHREKFYLVYSSGRFKESILSVIEKERLIQPDAIISNVGTEIYYAPNWDIDKEWEKIIGKNWNKEKIASILSRFYLQPQPYEKKFVIPYYIEEESIAKKVRETLKGHRVKVICTRGFQLQKMIKAPVISPAPISFSVFSDKLYLDIVPECAGKGNTAKYIRNEMSLPIICCGDAENDENMLKISNYGILVGNTSIRLKSKLSKFSNIYLAKSYYAKGVIEGLKFYSIIKKNKNDRRKIKINHLISISKINRKESKMNDSEIRDAVLEAAYNSAKEVGSIEGGIFNVYKISKLEGVEKKKIDFNADYLDKKGLVKWATMGGGMAITVEGIYYYERAHKHK